MLAGDFWKSSRIGIEVATICPGKKKGEKVATAIHDFEQWQTYTEKPGHLLSLSATFDEVYQNYKEYDGIWIPGGRAPEYLRMNP